MVFVKEETIRGQKFRIEVDGAGNFTALVNEERIFEKTLDALTEKLGKITKAAVKPVPFCRIREVSRRKDGEKSYEYELLDGVITRRNIGNRNLMVKLGNQKADQEHCYRDSNDYIRPLSDDEKVIYLNLYRNLAAAEKAIDIFEESRILDIKKELGEPQ